MAINPVQCPIVTAAHTVQTGNKLCLTGILTKDFLQFDNQKIKLLPSLCVKGIL